MVAHDPAASPAFALSLRQVLTLSGLRFCNMVCACRVAHSQMLLHGARCAVCPYPARGSRRKCSMDMRSCSTTLGNTGFFICKAQELMRAEHASPNERLARPCFWDGHKLPAESQTRAKVMHDVITILANCHNRLAGPTTVKGIQPHREVGFYPQARVLLPCRRYSGLSEGSLISLLAVDLINLIPAQS